MIDNLTEATRLLNATQLMLLGKDNQPISDLYYALQIAVDSIEELKERREADKWILVSKKLPPVNSEVIVTDRDVLTSYQATYVGNGYWECDNGTFNDRIVAWKWFPETYKESENK